MMVPMKHWLPLLLTLPLSHTQAAGPAFNCTQVEAGSIEQQICQSEPLSALDRKMAEVYTAAQKKAGNEHPPMLMTEQRGWIKGRNDCWKSADQPACIADSYRLRIAALQARYGLVEATGPVFYQCDGNPAKEVVARFFRTEPPTAIVEFGDRSSLMYLEHTASGARYQGQNESLWERHGEAIVVWGYQGREMHCTKR
ncbi:MAG: MliC family protein [Pseudomonas sp.]|nr:MliC family protein [Pseudomonas sp. 51_B]